jgi:hypothetical protein
MCGEPWFGLDFPGVRCRERKGNYEIFSKVGTHALVFGKVDLNLVFVVWLNLGVLQGKTRCIGERAQCF